VQNAGRATIKSVCRIAALRSLGLPYEHIEAANGEIMSEVKQQASRRLKRKHSRLDNRGNLDELYAEQKRLFDMVWTMCTLCSLGFFRRVSSRMRKMRRRLCNLNRTCSPNASRRKVGGILSFH
jgi:hypothetical protein